MRNRSSWRRLVQVFRRDRREEIDEELSFNLGQRIRDYVARGLDPASARKAALERPPQGTATLASVNAWAAGAFRR